MDRICPLIGLGSDRRMVIDGVDGAHRCHATAPPVGVVRQMQSQLCLTAAHDRCERYRQYVARTGVPRPGRASVGDGLVSTRLVLAPEPAWRGIAGRARVARTGTAAAIGAGAVALGVIGVAATTMLPGSSLDLAELFGPPATASAAVSAEPLPSGTPSATPPASAAPASPSPTPTPTALATPVPTPTPVTTPASTPVAETTYTVAAGDTLALIAQRFGTTVEGLQAANGIEDPNEIVIGQVIVIP